MHKKTRNKKFLLGFLVVAIIGIFAVLYFGVFTDQTAQVSRITIGKGASAQLKMSTRAWQQLCKDKKPHVEITSPDGGEKYTAGQKMAITWRSCNVDRNAKVVISLQRSPANNTFEEYTLHPENKITGEWANVTKNDGKETVVLDANFHDNYKNFPFGSDFRMAVSLNPAGGSYQSNQSAIVRDFSDGMITVNPPQDAWTQLCADGKPRVEVLSPNGGETYKAGQKVEVKWRSCNAQDMVHDEVAILLSPYKSDGDRADINIGLAVFTVNDGNEIVSLPSRKTLEEDKDLGVIFGKNFKISVGMNLVSGDGLFDVSDELFTITR